MPGKTNPKCKIVTVADRRFLPVACCLLISIKDHLPASMPVSCLLAGVDLDDGEVETANRFLERHRMQPCVKGFSFDELIDDSLHVGESVAKATYLRLVMDSIIPADFDRVLYLDADTRVLAPLEPLLLSDLGGYQFAAAHDIGQYQNGRIEQARKLLGMPESADYFNSGVMLFDWKLTLQTGLLSDARDYAAANPGKWLYHDQDALNAVSTGRWKALDPHWNMNNYYFDMGGKDTPWIKHYTTGAKPWSKWRRPVWKADAAWYEKTLKASPWPEAYEKQGMREKLVMLAEYLRKSSRNPRRVIAYYLWPFLMSAGAKQRARAYLKRGKPDIEAMVERFTAEANGATGPK
ncbi:MAG: glycosyltransferase family 8 protein [Pseudomonadota bacterium]